MRKVFVIQLSFNNPVVIRNSLIRYYLQTDVEGLDIDYLLFDALYPMPDYDFCRRQIEQSCQEFNWEYHKLPKNMGQNGNLNFIFDFIKDRAKDNDLVAFWEPDSDVQQKEWLKACYKVTLDKSFHNIGFVTPHRRPEWILNNQGQRLEIAGHKCRHLTWPGGWPMGIYTWDFIKDMKSLYVSHDYYGGTEGDILNALSSTDRSGLMFEEIEDITNIQDFDVEYIAWKAETIRIPKGKQLDFVDWLKTKKK